MFLQLDGLDAEVLRRHGERGTFPPLWDDMPSLEQATNGWIDAMREERRSQSELQGGVTALRERVDRAIRTDEVEYLDREDVTPEQKVRLIKTLHRLNQVVSSYRGFLWALKPHIERVAKREGRPARVLELASGHGEFTLALAKRAVRQSLPVHITGSDIVPAYVSRANEAARKRRLDADFIELNAFDMDVEPGRFDIVFIAQSMHHFSPGQLAMMVAQARRVAPHAFVGIDGYRSLVNLWMLHSFGLASVTVSPTSAYRMWHDAVTSGRKFLPKSELQAIARIAAPNDTVRVRMTFPSHSVLEVT